jgi:hypothetical protein
MSNNNIPHPTPEQIERRARKKAARLQHAANAEAKRKKQNAQAKKAGPAPGRRAKKKRQ